MMKQDYERTITTLTKIDGRLNYDSYTVYPLEHFSEHLASDWEFPPPLTVACAFDHRQPFLRGASTLDIHSTAATKSTDA